MPPHDARRHCQLTIPRRWTRRLLVAAAATLATTVPMTHAGAPRPLTATPTASQSVPAYWLVAADGGIFSFGGLPFYGSMGGHPLNAPMVGMAPTVDHGGYWEVAADGGIFSFGDAVFHGSMGGHPLNAPVVGMASDPATGGYWEVAADGGIFSFDAPFFGSMGGHPLNKPVVGMAATPDGGGYWLVASDGGIFSFGDAAFAGSTGSLHLNAPVVGMAATHDGRGYWLVAADGGIFSFGDAPFHGSLGNDALSRPIVGVASTGQSDDGGYWMTDTNGAVSAFGNAGYYGSAPQHLAAPVVGMADGPGTGAWASGPYPSGSFGYDLYSGNDNPPACNYSGLPSGHTIGIVKATEGTSYQNPCLAHEAAWAGAGLNLYIYLHGGTDATPQPGCNGDQACNYGYEQGQYGFRYAQSQGVNPDVTWWLDVEGSWPADTSENDQVIAGAIAGLRALGINNVGIYTSPLGWSPIAGSYQPAVPLWLAWYGTSGPQYNCANGVSYAAAHGNALPTGGVWLTQYTDQATVEPDGQPVDGDYAC